MPRLASCPHRVAYLLLMPEIAASSQSAASTGYVWPVIIHSASPAAWRSGSGTWNLTWVFALGRVTGIEPALSTWESVRSWALICPELRSLLSAGHREIPVFAGANGTLMARRSWAEPGRSPFRPSAFQAGHIPKLVSLFLAPGLRVSSARPVTAFPAQELAPGDCLHLAGDGPRPVRAGSRLALGL